MSHRILLLMLCSLAPGAGGAARSTQPSAPINPPVLARSPGEATEPATEPAVEAIVTAVREHPIVAIGETHGSADLRAFLVGLSRDRSFREVTDTIAVEVSSSAQATIDAFLDGSADDHTLLDALRDGIFSETGAADPRSIELYQAIRDANRDSDATHQLRVLAVDAPLSWAKVDAAADLAGAASSRWTRREKHCQDADARERALKRRERNPMAAAMHTAISFRGGVCAARYAASLNFVRDFSRPRIPLGGRRALRFRGL